MNESIYDNIYDYFEIDAQLTGANIKSYLLYSIEDESKSEKEQIMKLAEMMSVTTKTVTNWIKGKKLPHLADFMRLAAILGCKVDDLIITKGQASGENIDKNYIDKCNAPDKKKICFTLLRQQMTPIDNLKKFFRYAPYAKRSVLMDSFARLATYDDMQTSDYMEKKLYVIYHSIPEKVREYIDRDTKFGIDYPFLSNDAFKDTDLGKEYTRTQSELMKSYDKDTKVLEHLEQYPIFNRLWTNVFERISDLLYIEYLKDERKVGRFLTEIEEEFRNIIYEKFEDAEGIDKKLVNYEFEDLLF